MMKSTKIVLSVLVTLFLLSTACSQVNTKRAGVQKDKPIMEKEVTLAMDQDSLVARIESHLDSQMVKRREKLTEEALSAISETQALLQEVRSGDKVEAIRKGEHLIGKLEVLLADEPELTLIPLDVNYQREELVTDIETVRKMTKLAQDAIDDGYYQLAANILKDMHSEMVISTFLLPTATFPEAIKAAVILLKKGEKDKAADILAKVLGTVVVEKSVIPLPILNAEQMISEAASIDKKNHENVDKVLNLLKNADYQLTLAEELGYGKRDKDFKTLSESIAELKQSVEKKMDSEGKFDSLKEDLKNFKERLFPAGKK